MTSDADPHAEPIPDAHLLSITAAVLEAEKRETSEGPLLAALRERMERELRARILAAFTIPPENVAVRWSAPRIGDDIGPAGD